MVYWVYKSGAIS